MKVSVVIPAYNEEKYISISLDSLSRQNFKDFEIIVCLNVCTDNTRSVVEGIREKKRLDVKIVEENRKGVAWARNTGFQNAAGEIIASADADTFYPKDWLKQIVDNFKKYDIVGLYGPVYMHSKRWSLRFSARYLFTLFLLTNHFFGNYNFNGMNFAVKREAFDKIGGFNTNWKSAEDVYIGIKLKDIGRVKFDRKLITYTHDRRFRKGSFKSLIHHIKNYINIFLLKKYPLDFKDIR
jgi:cellulose synthase/poly-beta-1,6-N-acetylglucosamine synthase-like glycosyltransferase